MSYLDSMALVKKHVPVTAGHPKIPVMVEAAITTLAARKGSSLHAIKNYISENYAVDGEKLSTYLKKFLKAAVESGDVIQTSGKGATGSFKINKRVKAKRKTHSVIPQKPLVLETSNLGKQARNRKKVLRTKKTSAKLLGVGYPVTLGKNVEAKFTGDQEVSDDSALMKPKKVKKQRFSIPSKSRKYKNSLPIKVKKPMKPLIKATVSPKGKPDNATTSSQLVKPESTGKSTKSKKNTKPKENALKLKKTVSKKISAGDNPRCPIPSTSGKSNVLLPTKVKHPRKLISKANLKDSLLLYPFVTRLVSPIGVSPKGKSDNTIKILQLVSTKGILKSTKAKEIPELTEKSTDAKKNPKSKEPAAMNLKKAVSKKISTENSPRFPIPSKSGKRNAPTKVKRPSKLISKANLKDSLLLYPLVTRLASPIGVSSKGKPDNTMKMPQLANLKGILKSTKAKEIPKPKKTQLRL